MFKNIYQKRDTVAQIYGVLALISCFIFVFVSISYADDFVFVDKWYPSFSFFMILFSLLISILFLVFNIKNATSVVDMEKLLLDNYWFEKTKLMIKNFNNSQLKKALDMANDFENKKNEELIKTIENLKKEFN